jgi:hypothetical protein
VGKDTTLCPDAKYAVNAPGSTNKPQWLTPQPPPPTPVAPIDPAPKVPQKSWLGPF